jgi:mono/diheme cytochrome c family protein
VILTCALCFAGCDSLGEAAAQSTDASLRALIDLLLTDLTNQVADSLDQDDPEDAGDMAGDSDDDVDDADDADDGTDGGDGAGDDPVTRGETLVADNCSVCHGADGASGFAPNIQGVTEDLIAQQTGGAGGHTSFELSEQDRADIAAYLASF